MTDDKQKQVRDIINEAVEKLIGVGASRSTALKLLALQSVNRLCIDNDDAALIELRRRLILDIDLHLNAASDETLQ